MLVADDRRHQDGHVPADHLLCGIAEQLFPRPAEGLDDTVLVGDDHCVGHGFKDRP